MLPCSAPSFTMPLLHSVSISHPKCISQLYFSTVFLTAFINCILDCISQLYLSTSRSAPSSTMPSLHSVSMSQLYFLDVFINCIPFLYFPTVSFNCIYQLCHPFLPLFYHRCTMSDTLSASLGFSSKFSCQKIMLYLPQILVSAQHRCSTLQS